MLKRFAIDIIDTTYALFYHDRLIDQARRSVLFRTTISKGLILRFTTAAVRLGMGRGSMALPNCAI